MLQGLLPAKWADCRLLPIRLTTTQKVVLLSVTASVALMGVLSRYLRRRKPARPIKRVRRYTGRRTRNSMRSPNDAMSIAGSTIGSTIYSDRLSVASSSIGGGPIGPTTTQILGQPTTSNKVIDPNLSAQQLGVMGMEALETVITFWEDALTVHNAPGGVSAMLKSLEETEFSREIQNLLDMTYTLQEQSELLFLDQRSVLFRDEHSIDEADELNVGAAASQMAPVEEDAIEAEEQHSQRSASIARVGSDPNFDSAESFASALDQVADMRDFEEFIEATYELYPLYQEAMKVHEESAIPARTIRTEMMNCTNDTEYLVKLFCIRQAFQYLFKDAAISQWVCDTGRQILTDLLCIGDRDTKEFLVGYEDMINYVQNSDNWDYIEQELESRNVKAMTFYDICLDFIILDSFRDLDNPPATVLAVAQNRFLSNGFKETALATAVWSVLKAKKRMLKFPDGFMSHFYVISEQISPLMAWGFFGPDENLRDICNYFREQLMGFLADIFNFQKCRYTTVEELAEDILQHMKERVNNIGAKFSQ